MKIQVVRIGLLTSSPQHPNSIDAVLDDWLIVTSQHSHHFLYGNHAELHTQNELEIWSRQIRACYPRESSWQID
ncbi:hypothetical protein G6701_01410 [Polynucleobacter paneuropaeus]|nr:hypothetical protein [Polynucleobacter paneuropaeus]MBT8574152.1 hypothetical protein [Polynucleobacter paneuropaeus]